MTVAGRTFVDTNILAYAHDASDPGKQAIARAVLEELWADRSGVLSTQVLQEFYVVATRKFDPPLRRGEAREIVALYSTWTIVAVDVALILDATTLEEAAQLSFWDALMGGRRTRLSSLSGLDGDHTGGEGGVPQGPCPAAREPRSRPGLTGDSRTTKAAS
jgi:predicted nucleic acid-binding protein